MKKELNYIQESANCNRVILDELQGRLESVSENGIG